MNSGNPTPSPNKLQWLLLQHNALELAFRRFGPEIIDQRVFHKRPQSTFIRQAMAVDARMWRFFAFQRQDAGERAAELRGIRIVHRYYRAGFIEAENRCFDLLDELNLSSFRNPGGVN